MQMSVIARTPPLHTVTEDKGRIFLHVPDEEEAAW